MHSNSYLVLLDDHQQPFFCKFLGLAAFHQLATAYLLILDRSAISLMRVPPTSMRRRTFIWLARKAEKTAHLQVPDQYILPVNDARQQEAPEILMAPRVRSVCFQTP